MNTAALLVAMSLGAQYDTRPIPPAPGVAQKAVDVTQKADIAQKADVAQKVDTAQKTVPIAAQKMAAPAGGGNCAGTGLFRGIGLGVRSLLGFERRAQRREARGSAGCGRQRRSRASACAQ